MPKLNVLNINGQNVGEIEQKLEVAEENLGNKKELVELDKVL